MRAAWDWNCRRRRFEGRHRNAGCNDHSHPALDEFGRDCRQPIGLIFRPAIVDGDVLALEESSLTQAPLERADKMRRTGSSTANAASRRRPWR